LRARRGNKESRASRRKGDSPDRKKAAALASSGYRGQLQPHFLFNTLQAATTLIYQDPEGAEEILLSLSELLRFSLEELSDQEVPLAHETRFLEHYMVTGQITC
jgi:LytS/YehU family sensor histidine kinase